MGLLDDTKQAQYYAQNDYGNYQFTSLDDIITQFQIAYVGEDKIISKVRRADIAFHAHRAVQELSFDTFKSIKAQEITLPPSLQMTLPQDYVNYTKISWVDSAGIKHLLYPTSKTSNPTSPQVDSDGEFSFDANRNKIPSGELIRNGNFEGNHTYWELNRHGSSNVYHTPVIAAGTIADPLTDQEGWFYSANSIIGYNVPTQENTIKQSGLPFISGEQYTVTYTLSGYSSGSFNFVIIDENGHYTSQNGAGNFGNGTFTDTITAGATVPTTLFPANTIYFQNLSPTPGNVTIDNVSVVRVGFEETSTTWSSYKSTTPSENQDDYQDDTYWPMDGSRFGLDPQHAQANGSFYIDNQSGKIHFSSNVSGKTVILDYISDSIGTDEEMQVHKFAEEAMYKWIAHAILSTRANVQEYVVQRFKKERFAAIRTAKLRLSNIKIEELTQILRGKSKQIKH